MKTFLNIVVEMEGEEDDLVSQAKNILQSAQNLLPENAKATMTREGDKSGGNLLVPRIDGRINKHLNGKKILIKDILN